MDKFYERYNRQLILQGFGEKAQRALESARVLVIGAGGLGCPILQYLVSAGVGTIGLVDHDTISLSNLHRQVLYNAGEIGLLKVEVAAGKLSAMNPLVKIYPYPFQLDPLNAVNLISEYDYVIDGSDNFSTRYLVNDVCYYLQKPLVFGAVSEYEGQVVIFNVFAAGKTVNYRDLFPVQPGDGEFANCAEAGVLGVLPGIIGTMQAAELVKLITGVGEPLVNRLLTYNLLRQEIFTIEVEAASVKDYTIPASAEEFAGSDYGEGCRVGTAFTAQRTGVDITAGEDAATTTEPVIEVITKDQLRTLIDAGSATLIDVREENETPALQGFEYVQIPLSVFPVFAEGIEGDPVILFCQSGKRSLKAAEMLREVSDGSRRIYSLQGGVMG
ncbi:MAG: hypothetical protein EOO05_07645 [Chitinophagaceae bacterium]|nr:MAG: hypothetical protein EOO05_07645 [Chitinophagaceae bacterium]